MNDAVIIDAVRTPMGRSKNGVFRNVRAEDLSVALVRALLERNPALDPADIEDVVWGCVQQTKEQAINIAKMIALQAKLPENVTGYTVNRLCGSSMQALHDAARSIQCGDGDVYLVGGVEHMGHVPMTHGLDLHPNMGKHTAQASAMMGLTAEMLGAHHKISREAQDAFSVESHRRAHEAAVEGRYDNEIIPVPGHDEQGQPILVKQDEVVRPELSMNDLAKLRPAFNPAGGTITAGSSSALSDGASALLVMSRKKAEALGLKPRARILSMASAGVPAAMMGIGPVPATEKALARAELTLGDIDKFELNEAFAAQSLSCVKVLELEERTADINVNGGAIALGHPLGCSGSRIVGSLMNVLEQTDGRYGLATMCIGMGQGIATVIERY
ncbi:acetyl-CoA C-acyltransferase FadA [Endozoicomonas euniceicola]|uniref:acetyl-CoA C-acyltransferase n=1 Tax=Endozoicomonas euniceicola TaxID=1234143 RepID=A0ABY6GYZ3_9GAMM|nr:acetyl-CoA C-acyltransferase FadA [Endozoicomonas euniceicola]UYM17604.1 acetyl-CoA C-acyltransferase FadA [Endozoicomonas euniceicola]